jgi:membrane protease YdiL (CAAX protease family)
MLKGSLQHYSPLSQLLLSLIIVVISFMLSMFAGSLLAYFLLDVNLFTDSAALDMSSESVNISALKFYQSVYPIGMFVIPPFIFAYLVNKKVSAYLFLNKKDSFNKYFLAILVIVFALPLINFMGEINSHLKLPEFMAGIENWMRESEEQAKVISKKFLSMETPAELISNLVMIAVIPALGEELLFRGVIQGLFARMTKNIHWGILITAFLFSALHMQFFGFLPRMAMGVLFGYLLVWTNNLWIPIIAHLVNNGFIVVMSYFIYKGNIPAEVENVGASNSFAFSALVSAFFVGIILFHFYRTRERQL